jgi:hypothetical protein
LYKHSGNHNASTVSTGDKTGFLDNMQHAEDAPVWGSIYSTSKSWSRIFDGWHGRSSSAPARWPSGVSDSLKKNGVAWNANLGSGYGWGWVEDAGGAWREYMKDPPHIIQVILRGILIPRSRTISYINIRQRRCGILQDTNTHS